MSLPVLNTRDGLLRHRHGLPGARIAAGPRAPPLDGERTEAAQLHPVAAPQRLGDLVEDRIDDILDIALIEMRIRSAIAERVPT